MSASFILLGKTAPEAVTMLDQALQDQVMKIKLNPTSGTGITKQATGRLKFHHVLVVLSNIGK